MSEALEKRELPDFPTVDTPANRINIRKALAGLHLLNGEGSQFRCLTKAGYSRATARRVRPELSAKACLEEAAKLDSLANPANLLSAGRRRAMLAIESVDPQTVRLADAMRMLDTVEKYYGGHQLPPSSVALNIADRLSGIAALLVLAQQRGLPVPALPPQFVEAEVVATVATSTVNVKDDSETDAVTPDKQTR